MILFVIMSCLSRISPQWHFIFPEILSIIFLYVASQPPGWKRWAQRELIRLVINAANSRSFISGLRLALLSSSLSPRLLCQSAALSFSSPPESPSSAPPPAPAAHHPAIPPPPAAITTSCQEKEPLSQCVCEWLCVCVCAEAIQEKKKKIPLTVVLSGESSRQAADVMWHDIRSGEPMSARGCVRVYLDFGSCHQQYDAPCFFTWQQGNGFLPVSHLAPIYLHIKHSRSWRGLTQKTYIP